MAPYSPKPSSAALPEKERLEFLSVTRDDSARLQEIGTKLLPHMPEIIERFYSHLKHYDITRTHLSNSDLAQRLHKIQLEYFTQFFASDLNADYFVQRKMIGKTHGRIGLDPHWFIGAYSHYVELIVPLIRAYIPEDADKREETIISLVKLFLLDIQIAIEAYIERYASQLLEVQKTLEQKLWIEDRLLYSIMKKAGDAIIGLDEQDRIVTWSQSAQRIFEYKTIEIIDKKPSDLLQDQSQFERLKALADEQGNHTMHALIWRRKDGQPITADTTLTALRDQNGDHIGATLIVQDVTEIHRLATEVKNMEKLSAMTKITAGVAHEIRTPLGILSLTADLIHERALETIANDEHPKEACEEIIGHIKEMQIEVARVNEIVNHYLVLSKIKSPSKQTIDLQWYLDAMLPRWENDAQKKGIAVIIDLIDPEIEVAIDPDQFRHVFHNLFDNAVHAISAGGAITIQAQTKGDEIEIVVRDNGIGINKERIETLFSPFVTNKPGGTGLGLYLVKEIVEAHHGRVAIESEEGHGTNVFIVLSKNDGTLL